MSNEGQDKQSFLQRIRSKYRLVIVNEDTFEERSSFRLSRLSVFTFFGLFFLIVVTLTVLVMAYTPIRESIPGYTSNDVRSLGMQNDERLGVMEDELSADERYLENIRKILAGEDAPDSAIIANNATQNYDTVKLSNSETDAAFRANIEKEDQYSVNEGSASGRSVDMASIFFFTPLRGKISQSFNADTEHFGVDIVANRNEPIKTTLDGTVIFAEWTTDNGYVMYIQHAHNLVSVYKHNSKLMKKVGDRVKAGDSIGIIGDTGESSEGPHLHFELWQDGKPIDPQSLMVFR